MGKRCVFEVTFAFGVVRWAHYSASGCVSKASKETEKKEVEYASGNRETKLMAAGKRMNPSLVRESDDFLLITNDVK